MFLFCKRISKEEIHKALVKKDIQTIIRFINKNKRKLNIPQKDMNVTEIFRSINLEIPYFSFEKFKKYVDTLIQCKIDPQFIILNNSVTRKTLLHNCIRLWKSEHAKYLLQTKLFSIDTHHNRTWDMFFDKTIDCEQNQKNFINTFHIIMENGGDLNLYYHYAFVGSTTVLEHIFQYHSAVLFHELEPYTHSLTEQNLKLYKQHRLQKVFS